ncbi:MAG: magnesium-translocating P-type ATPase [Thermoanaerobacteraceae bacterium]|nr:magnesium-translocating P-type ATPase [Thermoanaerobacteraceae bacterium]
MKKNKKNVLTNTIIDRLTDFSMQDIKEVFTTLNTTQEGLDSVEAELRLEMHGTNQIVHERIDPWFVQLIKAFINPFIGVLIFLAGVSLVMDVILAAPEDRSWRTVIVITVMVTISGLLRFIQEYRSNKEAEKLKAMVHTTATVVRSDTGKQEIEMAEIVPGDIIHLAAGDMIPADVRIISSKDLFVSQSSLTGESEPVEKYDTLRRNVNQQKSMSLSELDNICFMGTNVVSGSAVAVVLSTGNDTYFGSMAKSLVGQRALTSFDRGVNSISWLLIRFMFVMVPIVFLVNGFTKGNWLDAFLFAVSVAVGLTPEMLPMIVTTNLAKGAVAMAKRKTVVKRLNAIQNFGAMDILCTDKTGTLTLDKIVLECHLDIHGNEDDRVLRHAYLNSYYQTGLKNLMDVAILEFGAKKGFENLEKIYRKVDEIPFDFTRRRMSVVLQNGSDKRQLVTKGAVEEMLSICTYTEYRGEVVPLTDDIRKEVKEMVKQLNKEGMRVLAVAQKNNVPHEGVFSVKDESEMVLMGYIGFLDPPKETAASAIKALNEYGVKVKILTGDNEIVTKKICREVGLPIENILLGSQIDSMVDEELAEAAENTTIFAKLSPLQKSRIIKMLQSKGHTVGYMGDGINDAAALREADVGISVDTAVDIAKESADIILLEKSLTVLEEGVIEGRKTFGNIIKYIKMTVSSNFGNMFSVLAASAFLPFLPMLPIHLLVQNLLYDISQISIPWDNMDEDYLKVPRRWDASNVGKFMIFIGPISSIFDIITYLVMWFVFKANTPAVQSLFQSGWFIEGLLSQTLIVHMIRTEKIPFIQSRAAKPVLLLTGTIMVIGIAIPFTPFGASIGLQALPLTYFPWLIGILFSYCLLTQAIKTWYIKKFKTWL